MTCVITFAIGTSPVWRAKCPQTSSWMNGRGAPSLTWRTSPDPVAVCQSRWEKLLRHQISKRMMQHCNGVRTIYLSRCIPWMWEYSPCGSWLVLSFLHLLGIRQTSFSVFFSLQNASWLREPDECATTPLGTPGTCGLPSHSTADNCSDTGTYTHTLTGNTALYLWGNTALHM